MHLTCLMAGIGSRLGPMTRSIHKSMVIANDRRLIDYQLATFREAGVTGANFVLGHGAIELSEVLFKTLTTSDFATTFNPLYSERNLDWSAYLGLRSTATDTIYYEGDLLLPPSLLRELEESRADICLAVDSTKVSTHVDAVVTGRNGKVGGILLQEHGNVTEVDQDNNLGELICAFKLSNRARKFVRNELQHQTFVGTMKIYSVLESAFTRFETDYVSANGRPWVEVDNKSDLERACNIADRILVS